MNTERNGFQKETLWAHKKNINWKGEYCELEMCIPTANKKNKGDMQTTFVPGWDLGGCQLYV